jgi:soluble lytic murein transglycosylase
VIDRRRTIARVRCLALFALFPLAASAAAAPLLEGAVDAGHGVALDSASRGAARALARGMRAIDEGRLGAADKALSTAGVSPLLDDYIKFQRARLLYLRGKYEAAAELAATIDRFRSGSSLAVARDRLRGDALAAAGDEAGARDAWRAALDGSTDIDVRRSLKLMIVESSIRAGEVEAAADPDQLLARVFEDSMLPSELAPYSRSSQLAMRAADDFVAEGRGEQAVLAYQEALAGTLTPAEGVHARMQLGLTLFKLRRYEEAIAEFAELLPEPHASFWHARSAARLGRIEQSIAEFEALAETAPPDLASHALFLAGTLLEDRDLHERALAHFDKVAAHSDHPARAGEALWRIGWSHWHARKYKAARKRFVEMTEREDDPIKVLRPRYWAARAAGERGDEDAERKELAAIARANPLTYYGWRAQQRLGAKQLLASGEPADAGSSALETTLPKQDLQRAALLIEAGLVEAASEELVPIAGRAHSVGDHIALGQLLVASGDYFGAQRLVVDRYVLDLSQGLRPGEEALWWLAWPPAFRGAVDASLGLEPAIEPALVWSIMREESGFRPEVMSSAGAIGLLQLMPETADRVAKRNGIKGVDEAALSIPETNILLGSRYLEELMRRFRGRESAVIGSYNAGPRAVERWLKGGAGEWDDDVWVEDIPYGQTRAYVKRVLRSLFAYRAFY